jgi:RHS repeat-associated protein
LYGLIAFTVQYWNGSAWTTIPNGNVTGNNKVWRKFTFSPITTSKIRVTINTVPDSWSRVVEIQAFGTSAGGEKVQWLVPDHLGTPRIVLDQTGSLVTVKRHDYLPFGEELVAGTGGRTVAQGYSGDGVRQQFTSKERDTETGLDYFLARYYSPIQGRFTSPDEFSGGPDDLFDFTADAADNPTFYGDLSNPQSLNKYSYTYNNPINLIDEDGHCPICVIVVVAVVILTSPDTTNAPRENDPVYRSGDGMQKAVLNGALGPIRGGSAARGAGAASRATRSAAPKIEARVQRSVTQKASHVGERIPKAQRAKPTTRKVKEEVYSENKKANKGKLKCDECGRTVRRSKKDAKGVTQPKNAGQVDHIVPRSKGGQSDKANLRVTCRACNRKKSDNDD